MPNVKVVDMAGKEVGEIALSDVIFGADVNGAVLHAAVTLLPYQAKLSKFALSFRNRAPFPRLLLK